MRDLDDKISLWNKGAQNYYGWTCEEVMGEHLHSLLKTEFPKPMDEVVRDLYVTGSFTGEVIQKARDGRVLISLCRWVLDRERDSILTSHTDITEWKNAELNLAQREKELGISLEESRRAREVAEDAVQAKDQLISLISHELKTPLTPIMIMLPMLLEMPALGPDTLEIVEMIERNVNLEAALIDQLLAYTKISSGKDELYQEIFDAHAAIHSAIEVANPDISAKHQQLAVSLGARTSTIRGDTVRFQQAIWNLLKNASKFTAVRGHISVSTRTAGRNLVIEITDGGIGIPEEAMGSIFRPFEQGGKSMTRQYGGLGLGLTICKAAIDAHGGQIHVSSPGNDLLVSRCDCHGQGSSLNSTNPGVEVSENLCFRLHLVLILHVSRGR